MTFDDPAKAGVLCRERRAMPSAPPEPDGGHARSANGTTRRECHLPEVRIIRPRAPAHASGGSRVAETARSLSSTFLLAWCHKGRGESGCGSEDVSR